jgi:hypothetical protein
MAVATQKNLIHENSVSTGTGNFTTTAVNGKIRFGDATYGFNFGATTNVFDYFISNRDAAEWEIGTGHCSAIGTLVRDTVTFSSNANALVNFSAGTKDVCNDIPAAIQLRTSNNLSDLASAATARTNLGATTIGSSLFTAATASAALALLIPSGTLMLFQQTSAPTGFTKQTTHNDKALRVVSGAASSGGVQAFSTVFSRTTTDGIALAVGNLPPHSHQVLIATSGGAQNAISQAFQSGNYAQNNGANDYILSTGSGTGFVGGMDIRTTYVDIIIASKD